MPIGRYILDFYCHERKLAIELDGGHHSEQKSEDALKDSFFKQKGISVLRFWNSEVLKNVEGVLISILEHLT